MVEAIMAHMMDALDEARKMKPTREMSLVITKLEEALLWYGAEQHRQRRESEKNS